MKTKTSFTAVRMIVICCLAFCAAAQSASTRAGTGYSTPTAAAGNFQKIFEGTINNSLVISMELTNNGGALSGSYFYLRTRATTGFEDFLIVNGQIASDGSLALKEYDRAGNNTGSFKASLDASGAGKPWRIQGAWSNGKHTLPLSLLERAFDLGQGVRVVTKSQEKASADPPYEINARWPQLSGRLSRQAQLFNREVASSILRQIDAFSKGDHNAVDTGSISDTLWIDYKVRYADSHLISVDFPQSIYFSGAAHPMSGHATTNYDLDRGRVITLAELFTPGADYLKAIATIATRALQGRLLTFWEDGAAPKLENYGAWLIEPGGLVVIFNPYQVTAYAEGSPTVFIPFSALRQIIRRNGPAARFIK